MSGWGALAARLGNEADQRKAAAEAEFSKLHGCSSSEYISRARQAAVQKANTPVPEKDRSKEGRSWMSRPAQPNSPSASVNEYHALEEAAKTAAKKGDISGAVENLDRANEVQNEYEMANFGNSDSRHDQSKIFRLQRRDSLGRIFVDRIETNAEYIAAKILVTKFFSVRGIPVNL